MHHSLLVRIKALLARDKYTFWWNELTDRDKELAVLSIRDLAGALRDARTRNDAEEEIVIEHMLSQRLAEIQSKATWGASVLGFIGAILGASLSVAMTEILDDQNECVGTSSNHHPSHQVISRPIQIDPADSPAGNVIDVPRKNNVQDK